MVGGLLHVKYLLQFWDYLFRLETTFLDSHAADEDSGTSWMTDAEPQNSRLAPAAYSLYSHNLSVEAGELLLLIFKCNLQ